MGIPYHLPNAGYDELTGKSNTQIPGMAVENVDGHWITYSFDRKSKCKLGFRLERKKSFKSQAIDVSSKWTKYLYTAVSRQFSQISVDKIVRLSD